MGLPPPAPRPLDAGERALLSALVRDVGPRLRAYVQSGRGAWAEADDLVAETFYRAAANIAALRACERQDLYLLTIARNLCRDRLRRPPPEPVASERLQTRPAAAPEPFEVLARDERERLLAAAVAALPEAQREIIVLRLSVGLKFEEIAELLGIPLGTALSRMHAAAQNLKTKVGCVL